MTKRNNLDKIGGEVDTSAPVSVSGDQLSFAVPTEFVELPSGGAYYSEDHPLYRQETIEIKYMTAKEEDILNSSALLKNGTAIDRMLQSVILDKNVKVQDLLIGDKNALTVAARISGYGPGYAVRVPCPSCHKSSDVDVDLEIAKKFSGAIKGSVGELDNVEMSDAGLPLVNLPKTGLQVEIRFLSSKDEKDLEKMEQNMEKHKLPPSSFTNLLKRIVASVNGSRDPSVVSNFVESMPAIDSRFLRGVYKIINPTMNLEHDFSCQHCGTGGPVEVPITPTFFWPDE